MNQFLTLNKNIPKSPKRQDFGYFGISQMPKTLEEKEAEFEALREKLEQEKKAFEKMKTDAEQEQSHSTPVVKRRRKHEGASA